MQVEHPNGNGPVPRRLLLVSRGRYKLPLDEALTRKFDALGSLLEVRVLAGSGLRPSGSDPRFALVPPLRLRFLDGIAFYVLLPARVALEALARGRAVIGGRAAGIPDVVQDGRNGVLVDPEDPAELADAIVRLLSDRTLAERLGAKAREDAERWVPGSGEYARHVRELVETIG